MSLTFEACLEFINVCQDVFVCYLWIDKLCILNLIYLAGFTYFNFNNTVIYFTIAICMYSTEIDNLSSIHCCLQLFAKTTIYLLFFFSTAVSPLTLNSKLCQHKRSSFIEYIYQAKYIRVYRYVRWKSYFNLYLNLSIK